MRRRDHPKIGDVWATSDRSVIFTVLNKEYDEVYKGWLLTILIGGNADGEEGTIRTATMDYDFKELDGVYWKIN